VLSGRYGPYVSHNKVNATIPRAKDPAQLSVDEAVALLAERIAKGGGKPVKKSAAKSKTVKAAMAANDDPPAAKKPAAKKKAKAG